MGILPQILSEAEIWSFITKGEAQIQQERRAI